MRTLLIGLLLASAAGPAFAAPDDRGNRRSEARSERSEQRQQARPQRAERQQARPQRAERQQARPQRAERQQVQVQRQERPQAGNGSLRPSRDRNAVVVQARNNGRAAVRNQRDERNAYAQRNVRAQQNDSVRNWRSSDRQRANSPTRVQERNLGQRRGGELVQQRRPVPHVVSPDRRYSENRPRFGTQAPEPRTARTAHARPGREWSRDWRRDRRYDWNNHRQRNRTVFRLGFYHDPFGWGYQRYNIGYRLWPSYYSSNYWLNDPWMYRLPPAYGPYRWVRYYDDALLVNIYSGQVVDVMHNFFW